MTDTETLRTDLRITLCLAVLCVHRKPGANEHSLFLIRGLELKLVESESVEPFSADILYA
jgi:hypothetical protein